MDGGGWLEEHRGVKMKDGKSSTVHVVSHETWIEVSRQPMGFPHLGQIRITHLKICNLSCVCDYKAQTETHTKRKNGYETGSLFTYN